MICQNCKSENPIEFNFCGSCGARLPEHPKTKIVKMYLHGDKESNREQGKDLGLRSLALNNFCGALYEVEFEVEVDMETGDTKIISCDGKKLIEE